MRLFDLQRVIGQDEAVQAVANAIRNHRAGLTEEKKPIGAFLFLGSSGAHWLIINMEKRTKAQR